MYLYFGTVVRNAPVNQGGSLYKLDWQTKNIIREIPIIPSQPDLSHDRNPRGNVRGCRGIRVHGDTVVVADYHSLNLFDQDLNLERKLSGDLMVGLHEIDISGSSVWLTSTSLDAVLKYRLADGKYEASYWPREMPEFQEALNTSPLEFDKSIDNRDKFLDNSSFRGPGHLHVNAVCEFHGEVYALFHSRCVVANLSKRTIVIKDKNLKHAHNLSIEDGGVVYVNDTHRTVVRIYDLESGKQTRSIPIRKMPGIKLLLAKTTLKALRELGLAFFGSGRKATARPFYLRGLAINDNYIFAGISPATIIQIDKRTGEFIDSYTHSIDARVCIHGLAC